MAGDRLSRTAGGRNPRDRDVRTRHEVDRAVLAPHGPAEGGRVRERDGRAAGEGDLLELGTGGEADPLAVGGEERGGSLFRARNRGRRCRNPASEAGAPRSLRPRRRTRSSSRRARSRTRAESSLRESRSPWVGTNCRRRISAAPPLGRATARRARREHATAADAAAITQGSQPCPRRTAGSAAVSGSPASDASSIAMRASAMSCSRFFGLRSRHPRSTRRIAGRRLGRQHGQVDVGLEHPGQHVAGGLAREEPLRP